MEDEATIGVGFPYVTEESGAWRTMPASLSAGYSGGSWSHGNWFCGFWVGLLIAAHLHTGEDRFLALARERMRLVAPRCEDPNTHDIGFIFWSSAVRAHHVTGEGWFADLAVRAAERLRARLITTPAGAYLSSWGPLDDPRGRLSSAIDTMANLPLLYWAADQVDDGSFRLAGEAHARMTQGAFIRADFSTYHAVEYDEEGKRSRGYTFQGHANESLWSRGQGWAIYGYRGHGRGDAQRSLSRPGGGAGPPLSRTSRRPSRSVLGLRRSYHPRRAAGFIGGSNCRRRLPHHGSPAPGPGSGRYVAGACSCHVGVPVYRLSRA